MLKRIPYDGYDDSEITYADCRESYKSHYNKLYLYDEKRRADKSVKGWIEWDSIEMFDECGMERLIMLIAGMLFCIENGGIPENDPADLAYTAWYDLQDFCTGNYDDLFKPGDIADIKQDVKTILDYYDAHPALKGD